MSKRKKLSGPVPIKLRWNKPGCIPLDDDERITQGDWVAECEGEDRSTSVPGPWVLADATINRTPRQAHVFACRPVQKGGRS